MMPLVDKLLSLANEIAQNHPRFFENNGPGVGDRNTAEFMKKLRETALQELGRDFSEKQICGNNKLAVDFFFPEEATIVEIALTLRNPNSEFYKDILKTILAQKIGTRIKTLVFVSKPGAIKRHGEPASQSIITLIKKEFGVEIAIKEITQNI
jgi:hypothetical protein